MKILIDDARNDATFGGSLFNEVSIPLCDIIVRTPLIAVAILSSYSNWDDIEIFLDHDMGKFPPIFVKQATYSADGYGVLCFIEEQHLAGRALPKSITLVTANASARVRMAAMLDKYYPVHKGNTWSM